jgi:phage tail sheath protein FI
MISFYSKFPTESQIEAIQKFEAFASWRYRLTDSDKAAIAAFQILGQENEVDYDVHQRAYDALPNNPHGEFIDHYVDGLAGATDEQILNNIHDYMCERRAARYCDEETLDYDDGSYAAECERQLARVFDRHRRHRHSSRLYRLQR